MSILDSVVKMALSTEILKFYAKPLGLVLFALGFLFLAWKYSQSKRQGIKMVGWKYLLSCLKALYKDSGAVTTINLYRSTNESVIGIYSFPSPILFIRDPELIHLILVKDFPCFSDRGIHSSEDYDPLSGNMVALKTEKWKKIRSKVTPAFSSGKLKAIFFTLLECGTTLGNYLDKLANNGELLDIWEISACHFTNVITSIGFGIEIDAINDPKNEFRAVTRKIFQPNFINRLRSLLGFAVPKFLKLFRLRAFDRSIERFILSVVKQNLELRECQNLVRKDYFQLLIQLRNGGTIQKDNEWEMKFKGDGGQKDLTLNEIAAQSFSFFAAGVETSSTTASFCMFELAKNPEIQRRVHEEIDRVLEKYDGQITYESVAEMKFLDTCIDETLRKYPPIFNIPRNCLKDYEIPATGQIIPEGTQLFIPVIGIHRDAKYYPDPERFIPDRFNEENSKGKNQINRPYYPFGDGPRGCIAKRLGKLQTKMGLITMLKNFKFELVDRLQNQEIEFDPKYLFLSPLGGINLKVCRR